jgi:hypothetical protein
VNTPVGVVYPTSYKLQTMDKSIRTLPIYPIDGFFKLSPLVLHAAARWHNCSVCHYGRECR